MSPGRDCTPYLRSPFTCQTLPEPYSLWSAGRLRVIVASATHLEPCTPRCISTLVGALQDFRRNGYPDRFSRRSLLTDPEERAAANFDARGGCLQKLGPNLPPHVVDGPRGRAGE